MVKLKFTKQTEGIYGKVYEIGEIIDYHPWEFDWQGMNEKDRVGKGIYVHCYGHGEFEVYRDVIPC